MSGWNNLREVYLAKGQFKYEGKISTDGLGAAFTTKITVSAS